MGRINIYQFLSVHGIPCLKDVSPADQTHVLRMFNGPIINIQLTTKKQFDILYSHHLKTRNFTIMCNPGSNVPRKLFLDIDGDKPHKGINLTHKQCTFIIDLFGKLAKELYGAGKMVIMNKPESNGNIHLVITDTIIDGVNHQRLLVRKMRNVIQKLLDDGFKGLGYFEMDLVLHYEDILSQEELEMVLLAVDDAPGIRALYSAKSDNLNDYYKMNTEPDQPEFNLRKCLLTDPSYIYERCHTAVVPLEYQNDIQTLIRIKEESRHLYVDAMDYENTNIIDLKTVIAYINKIPESFIKGYFKFIGILKKVKSQFVIGMDDRNAAIIAAFDHMAQKDYIGYDAVQNGIYYETCCIEKGGFEKLTTKIDEFIVNKEAAKKQAMIKKITRAINMAHNTADILTEMPGRTITNVDHEHIKVDFNDYDSGSTVIINSNTGTGKTYNLIKFIKDNADARLLYIGCRKTLLKSLNKNKMPDGSNMFNYYGDINWTDARRNCADYNRVLIQMESIGKLSPGMINSYDYIIMDEYNAIIEQLNSPNYVDIYNAMNAVCCIFKSPAVLVAMDGYINNSFINMFEHVRPAATYQQYVINNTRQNKCHETMMMVTDVAEMYQLIRDNVAAGKRIVVACDSKNKTKAIQQTIADVNTKLKITNRKCFIIHGDNSMTHEVNEFMGDINNAVKPYHYFIYSPSITAGVDININHFDVQFNLFTNNTSSKNENLQMTNRARVKLSNMSYTYINKPQQPLISADDIIESYSNRGRVFETNDLMKIALIPYGNYIDVIKDHPVIKIMSEFKHIKTRDNNRAVQLYIAGLKKQGYVVKLHESRSNVAGTPTEGDMLKKVKSLESAYVASVTALQSQSAAGDLMTLEMIAQNHKYVIMDTYKLAEDTITADFINDYGTYDKMKQFKNRITIMNSVSADRYVNDSITSSEITREYDDNSIWSGLLSHKRTTAHYVCGMSILNAIVGDKLPNINRILTQPVGPISKQYIIDRIKQVEHIQNLKYLTSLFGFRTTVKGAATLGQLLEKNWRTGIRLVNNILTSLYGISFIAENGRRIKFKIKISGYAPSTYARFNIGGTI